ncbi:MAG: hypothetical protein RSG52_07295 [Terrisporobacter sp.]|uniref:tetratricopeptide repeat protein n=1 Tax=Terrisporobacter sp. TaxID=1965305 RepID=UPI002FC90BBF
MKNIFKALNISKSSCEEEVNNSYFNLMKKNYDEIEEESSVISLARKRIDKIDEAFKLITDMEDYDYLETKYETLYTLAEEYKKHDSYNKALLLSNELIDFIPIFPDSYLLKADILAEMNRHNEALKFFQIAEEMEDDIKDDQYVQYLKAQSQMGADLFEDAIITLKKIIKLYGENPFFFYDIACCYENLGNKKMYNYYCERRDKYWRGQEKN